MEKNTFSGKLSGYHDMSRRFKRARTSKMVRTGVSYRVDSPRMRGVFQVYPSLFQLFVSRYIVIFVD